ncbi:Rho GTPase-activating protein 12 [Vairimorpha necatrix]|uniref:Rho GTPase-activating protein 12 n=1 Tax=Vairimorpha necatrix TaxID=6039 RepID=A0AAX4JC39_9MICR
MENQTDQNHAVYDTLSETEKQDLKQKCIDDITGNNYEIFCPLICLEYIFCINKDESFCTDAVIKMMNKLIEKSKTYKIFYGNFEEQEIQKNCDLIKKEEINLENLNIYLVGQIFIRIVNNNQKLMLPEKINKELLNSYVRYNPNKQKEIVKRIPFIINKRNRIFLKLLQELFNKIEENKEINKTSRNDLLHIFGPMVFKGELEDKQIHGYHRMVILEDVLNTDFDHIEEEIYKN